MTTPAPMTAEQIVEALCDASAVAAAYPRVPWEDSQKAIAHRDRIKAALVKRIEAADDLRAHGITLDDPRMDYIEVQVGRATVEEYDAASAALEEACRGK